MKTVTKFMPSGTMMAPEDLLGVFKEAGFHFDSEDCPMVFTAPWFAYQHADGATTYVQLHGSELKDNGLVRVHSGRF